VCSDHPSVNRGCRFRGSCRYGSIKEKMEVCCKGVERVLEGGAVAVAGLTVADYVNVL